MLARNKTILIGIDPGSVVTGIAVWDRDKKALTVHAYKSHCAAILQLKAAIETVGPVNVFMRIEDARMGGGSAERKQGAGYVKALSKDWEEFAKLVDVKYELVSPRANQTKTTPEFFKQLTGITTLKTEHHMRDAAMLVYKL